VGTGQGFSPFGPRWYVSLAVLVAGAWLLASGVSDAQHGRPVRIGVLTNSFGLPPPAVGLRDGLLALGYRENEQFVLGVRFTGGDMTTLHAGARELIEHGADLIFASGANPARAAREATKKIPIVFAAVGDPVELGLVESFARPGGNVTGVADRDIELGAKRLEVFREVVPGLKRILYLYDGNDPHSVAGARVYRDAARQLGLELVERMVRTEKEAQSALADIRRGEVHGILGPLNAALNIPGLLLEIATQRKLAIMGVSAFWVEQGGLASYGADFYETGRQAARLVDKILRGMKPAEIPVEVNSKIEFSINVRAAKALGLTIAPEILYRADRVVQ
jgi:putative ABC transport system substrate-binding protein